MLISAGSVSMGVEVTTHDVFVVSKVVVSSASWGSDSLMISIALFSTAALISNHFLTNGVEVTAPVDSPTQPFNV